MLWFKTRTLLKKIFKQLEEAFTIGADTNEILQKIEKTNQEIDKQLGGINNIASNYI